MKLLTTVIFCLAFLFCSAQDLFEPGYYINTDSTTIRGFIKNEDWKIIPSSITFKKSKTGQENEILSSQLNEFGIDGESKFVKRKFPLELSENEVGLLDSSEEFRFDTITALVRVLVDGNASLFLYQTDRYERYFFTKAQSDLKPLIYKKYQKDNWEIYEYKAYQQELQKYFACPSMDKSEISEIKFVRKQLVSFFTEYNTCRGHHFVDFNEKISKSKNFYKLQGGLFRTSFSTLGIEAGLQLEHILAFHNGKYSTLVDVAYRKVFHESIEYNSLMLIFGFRSYFNTPSPGKFFAQGQIGLERPRNNNIKSAGNILPHYGVSLGYKMSNRVDLLVGFTQSRNLPLISRTTGFSYYSFNAKFGIRIF